jgi:AcrR family transcriptional regulator
VPQPVRKLFQARRERRIARRRNEILRAAAQVFAQKGYAATTTREIAAAADIAEGTLYNYFEGKRDILISIIEKANAPLERALRQAEHLEDRETIVALFERALNVSEKQLPFTRTLLSEAWMDDHIMKEFVQTRLHRVAQLLTTFIEEGIASGAIRAVDAETCTRLIMGMFAGLILPVMRGAEPPPSPDERRQMAETAVDLILYGLRPVPVK